MKITLKNSNLLEFRNATTNFQFHDGKNVIQGPQGSGKTTQFDAFAWGCWGKNSSNEADFELSKLVGGEAVKKSDSVSEQIFDIDGREFEIRRVYHETYNAKGIKTGNKTTYFVDGVKTKTKKQFEAAIEKNLTPHFQICSDIEFFAAKMPWKERRDLLISMVETVDKESIIDAIDGFRALLNGRTIETAKSHAEQRQKSLKEKLATAKADLKANQNIIDKTSTSSDPESIDQIIKDMEAEVVKAQAAIDDQKAGARPEDLEQLKELNSKLFQLDGAFNVAKQAAISAERKRVAKINTNKQIAQTYESDIALYQSQLKILESEWSLIKAKSIESVSRICGECGQELPEEIYNEKIDNFNRDKANALKENIAEGTSKKERLDELTAKLETLKNETDELEAIELDPIINAETTDDIDAVKKEIQDIKDKKSTDEVDPKLAANLAAAKGNLKLAQNQRAAFDAIDEAIKNVGEKKTEIKKYVDENEKIETFFSKHDEYIRTVVASVEEPINELFDKTRFRMFEKLENGNIAECCDVLDLDLKPYKGALSTGERIHIGGDCVKTFQRYYDLSVPVWIDHAVEITEPIDLDCQVILLETAIGELKQAS